MESSRSVPPRRKRRSILRYVFIFVMIVMMIATNGFGTLPDNSISQMFRDEIGKNLPKPFLDLINSYLDDLTVQPIEARRDTQVSPGSERGLDVVGILINIFSRNNEPPPGNSPVMDALASLSSGTQTELARNFITTTPVVTTTPLSTTNTAVMTTTPLVSLTTTAVPVIAYLPVPFIPAATRKPRPEKPAPTFTAVPVSIPAEGFSVSAVYLNGYSNSVTVMPGASVTVTYNFQITNDPCPTCNSQLVTGLGTAGTDGGTCAFNGIAGASPGSLGSENVVLTAPATPGTYSVIVEYHLKPICNAALANYSSGGVVTPQVIGQIVVVAPLVLYSPGMYDGNLGGRTGADSLCASGGPLGFTEYHAFISIDTVDTIAAMPSNLTFSNGAAIKSTNGTLIANNWSDLLDGFIIASLESAAVTGAGGWWSGTEDDYGSASISAANCNNFTSNVNTDYGNYGDTTLNEPGWMYVFPNSQTCDTPAYLVCVAVP